MIAVKELGSGDINSIKRFIEVKRKLNLKRSSLDAQITSKFPKIQKMIKTLNSIISSGESLASSKLGDLFDKSVQDGN